MYDILHREKASEMANFLRLGSEDLALNILIEFPSVAHVQDEVSSGYAIHIACFKGLTQVCSFRLTCFHLHICKSSES